jgi:hypothetical protein
VYVSFSRTSVLFSFFSRIDLSLFAATTEPNPSSAFCVQEISAGECC